MPGLALLERRIRRTAIQDGAIGLGVLGLGLVILYADVVTSLSGPTSRTWFLGAVGLGFLAVAVVMFQAARKLWPAQGCRLYIELSNDARGIGWAYAAVGNSPALKVFFLDGDDFSVAASEKDCRALLDFIHERAPHAAIGFGGEAAAAYRAQVERAKGAGGPT